MQSVPENETATCNLPGERVLNTRRKNTMKGIPVMKQVWEEIQKLKTEI
jgi:LDH2 family malate/lactate/ureidoglycolate dehydrogenase